jgi:hypothetical protein
MAGLTARLPWLLLMAVGAAVLVVAQDYGLGTPRRMRAGMFPAILGGLLLVVAVLGLLEPAREAGRVALRPLLAVLGAIAAFATVGLFGLVPAAFAATVAATFAEPGARPVTRLALGAGVAAGLWLVFIGFLGLPVPALRWPA